MRKIKLLTLLAALLFSAGMYVQAAVVASGTCGTDLAWSLSDDYALTISGTGTSMTDYSPASPAPWDAYKASIVSSPCRKASTMWVPMHLQAATALQRLLFRNLSL